MGPRGPGARQDSDVAAPAWAVALLRTARVARLATADAAGQPHAVPVCFAWDDGALYWAVDAKPKRTRELRRLRNIAENPRVSLVIDDYDEDWTRLRWVRIEGIAAVVDDAAERARALTALETKYPQYAAMDLTHTAGPVVRVSAERIRAWRAAEL